MRMLFIVLRVTFPFYSRASVFRINSFDSVMFGHFFSLQIAFRLHNFPINIDLVKEPSPSSGVDTFSWKQRFCSINVCLIKNNNRITCADRIDLFFFLHSNSNKAIENSEISSQTVDCPFFYCIFLVCFTSGSDQRPINHLKNNQFENSKQQTVFLIKWLRSRRAHVITGQRLSSAKGHALILLNKYFLSLSTIHICLEFLLLCFLFSHECQSIRVQITK